MRPQNARPELGEAVLRFRQERGLSQNQVSIRTGIDRFTISRMEQGLAPRLDIIEQFARAFGLDINDWRELAGHPRVEPSEQELKEVATQALEVARRMQQARRLVETHYEPDAEAAGPLEAFDGKENIPPGDPEMVWEEVKRLRAEKRQGAGS